MKNIALNYLIINAIITIFVFCLSYFFQGNTYYNKYGFISFLIISVSSLFVFLGGYLSFKLKIDKEFLIYLYCTLLKNGILILLCVKYRDIIWNIIFYLFFIYAFLMVLEIIFILKLSKKYNLENINS
jgi:hypothetical protein